MSCSQPKLLPFSFKLPWRGIKGSDDKICSNEDFSWSKKFKMHLRRTVGNQQVVILCSALVPSNATIHIALEFVSSKIVSEAASDNKDRLKEVHRCSSCLHKE
ncbi:hypothetical protein Tco_1009437 [Tanacetum coccineum]